MDPRPSGVWHSTGICLLGVVLRSLDMQGITDLRLGPDNSRMVFGAQWGLTQLLEKGISVEYKPHLRKQLAPPQSK